MSGSPACRVTTRCRARVGERLVAVELGPGRLVEAVRAGLEVVGLRGVSPDVEQVLDEHPERRAPVADVVLAHHVVAEVLQRAGQGVADDGGAQVRRRASPWPRWARSSRWGRPAAAAPVRRDAFPSCSTWEATHVGPDPQVDEAGTGDLRGLHDVVDVEGLHDLRRHVAGLGAQALGQRHRGVGLQVGERRGPDHRVGVGVLVAERLPQGLLEALGEGDGGAGHASKVRGHRPPAINCTAGR